MDEYGQKIPSRASRNQELYKEISKTELDNYEVRSNEAVIGDNKGSIDVEKIKSILDTHYKDAPKRRSIAIEDEEIVKTKAEETKEYDINVILDKAREVKEDDYEKERNKKLRNTGFDILNSLDFNEEKEESTHKVSDKTAEELANLINTISINEKAIKKASEESDPLALLEDLKGSDNTEVIEGIHDDNEKTLRWIETNKSKNQTVSVYGNDITSATDKVIIYDGDSKSKTLKLDDKYMIIYNGKVSDGSIGIEAVMSLNSQNYFIDNDSNGKYNVVIINDYEYYLVDAISKNTYTVNDYTAKTSVELGEADRLTVYENGIRTTADAIKQGSVIAVAKSADSSVISVQILDGLVTGEITSLSSGTMTISGTKYNISPSYAGDALKVGRGGSFYFDNYGRIVRCVGLKEASSQYGYLLNFYRGDDPNGDCFAEILTAEGTRETFTVKQSVNVNGEKCNLGTALQRIEKNQLVTYKVSSDKRITKINTANKSYIGRDTATEIFSMHFKGAGKYRKNNMCFNSKYLLDSTTPIFVIPYNEDKYDYTVMNPSLLVNNTTYDISVYDIDDYMYASCIVLKENFSEPENMRSKRSLIITDIYSGINDDDDEIIGLEGYQQGRKVTYQVKNKEMKDNRGKYYVRDLKAGDVVQVSVDVKGDVRAVQLLFKANEQKLAIAEGSDTPNKYWEGGTLVMPDLWVSFGTVTDRNTNVLLVDADGNDNIVSKDPHKFASATNVYIYENGNVYPSNKNEIFNDDLVYVQEYQGNLHEVMIIR